LIAAHGFGSQWVEECAIQAKELSDKLRGSQNRFVAQRVAWNSCLMRQPVPKTVALARVLVGLADREREPAKFAIAHRALGYSLLMAGEFREAREILDRGAALADVVPDEEFAVYGEHPSMVCRMYSGQAHVLMGFAETGTRLLEAAVTHARGGKNSHSLAWALGVAAHVFQLSHQAAKTDRFASEAIEMAREHRLPQWLALGERCKGWAMCRLGDREAGLALQHEGVRRWYETGAKLHGTHCEIMLAESYLYEGQVAGAHGHLETARAHCASYGENYLAAEIDRLEALLLQREDASLELVREYLSSALSIARQQSARMLELRCTTTLARALVERGERREPHDLLAPVYAWFTEGFDTPDLKEAKALLDELT
jgi:hypothetical protein